MGKPVPPQGQPDDVADDRLRVEIESLQRRCLDADGAFGAVRPPSDQRPGRW